jgi:uridine phosphorylase
LQCDRKIPVKPSFLNFSIIKKKNMAALQDTGRRIIDFDPGQPLDPVADPSLATLTSANLLPSPPPWPAGKVPTPEPLSPAPAESDDLTKFAGYDVVVMTWTSAEAASMAALFTPGYPLSAWYEYRHNVADYIPLVVGKNAPFNDSSATMQRYYHSMGLYFPCRIGSAKVLLFKSGLHFCYDGPQFPVKKLVAEIYEAVKPKVLITTGTGGAIGADVLLGDVVIAPKVRFDCLLQFAAQPFNNQEFPTSPLPAGVLNAILPSLTQVNAARVTGGRPTPKFWNDAQSMIVTTDEFAYDDSTDHYKLQGLGRACDMGDAMVALALQPYYPGLSFFAIRNASDPQIPNPDNNMADAAATSEQIYKKYGGLTTAASLVATWAVITTIVPMKQITAAMLLLLLLTGCGSSISLFDQYAYTQTTSIKVDASDVMVLATQDFQAHQKEVADLTREIRKIYEYDKNRPQNGKTVQQWDLMMDPKGGLLGGFLKEWQNKGKLDSVYVVEKITEIGLGFDQVIYLEIAKNKSSN